MLVRQKRVRRSPIRKWYSTEAQKGNGKTERATGGVTMAAGPVVSMQCGSPARELSLSVQQGGNQIHGDRGKSEETTGNNVIHTPILPSIFDLFATQANDG